MAKVNLMYCWDKPEYRRTVFAILEEPNRSYLQQMLALSYTEIEGIPSNIERIIFVPAFNEKGISFFPPNTTYEDKIAQVITLVEDEAEHLDSLWSAFNMDKLIFTGVIPLLDNSGRIGKYSSAVHTSYSIGSSLRGKLIETMSSSSGIPANRYYVASQLIPVENILDDTSPVLSDFYDQAEIMFLDGHTFVRHSYDEQHFCANQFHIPLYCVFVSAYMPLPRTISLNECQSFVQSFTAQFLDEKSSDSDTFFGDIHPQMFAAGLSVMNQDQLRKFYSSFSKKLCREASRAVRHEKKQGKALRNLFFARLNQKTH